MPLPLRIKYAHAQQEINNVHMQRTKCIFKHPRYDISFGRARAHHSKFLGENELGNFFFVLLQVFFCIIIGRHQQRLRHTKMLCTTISFDLYSETIGSVRTECCCCSRTVFFFFFKLIQREIPIFG